jgi:TusA-related sulfurtransferase
VLRVRAIFEPVPLYHVLGKQGFTHWTERLADDDWRIWFLRAGAQAEAAAVPIDAAAPASDMVVLDVRGLEPPEPMVRTLEALEQLPRGKALLQINARVPQMLLPLLAERGFAYKLVSETPNEVRGLIRRTNEEN